MYSRSHPLPPSSVGLRRMPSGTVSPGTPPPSVISALSTDQLPPPQQSQKRHSVSLFGIPTAPSIGNGGVSTMDPWAGAFTKTFFHERPGENCANVASSAVVRPYSPVCKLVAEFVGTLLFVFIGILSAVSSQHSDSVPVLSVAFGHGLAIFVVISSLGHVSGAHFNPAVSLGIALSGKMRPFLVPFYWFAQLSGGFCAAFLVSIVTTKNQFQSVAGGATIVPSGTNLWQALCAEALLTALLVLCVLCCAIDAPAQNALFAPLAIGMSISAAILGGASISGASLNPARSFGPCLAASLFIGEGTGSIGTKLTDPIWSLHFVYWVGPFIGAAFSAFLYRIFFARGDNRLLNR
ncbi:hypothetical protein niasHS_010876 [Heterodera schachtii]|uniref:Aquaporin n=1 Tax=Heterodera schachtii TaxID=97005 RepID=A0ABD2ISU3_HETSC